MNEELLSELLGSVREGIAIHRDEKSPAGKFTVEKLSVQQIRANDRLSQKNHSFYLSVNAVTPGNSLPSINSREAPPPVEI